jgi:hypothetical protein
MDITVEGGQGLAAASTDATGAKSALLDITVTDPTGTTALAAACKTRCHAAEAAALKKHKHYDRHIDASRYVLVPASLEVYGAACAELHTFIDAVATWKANGGSSTWAKASIVDWWRRRISFALQAGTSIVVDAALRRSRPSAGYALFTTVALLRTPLLSEIARANAPRNSAVHRSVA